MYETMSTVDVGTGKSTDIFWCKSSVASTATHQWFLVGNSKCFFLFTEINLSYPYGLSIYFFGDINSFRSNDPWATALCGHSATDPIIGITNNSLLSFNNTSTGLILAKGTSWIGGNASFCVYSLSRHSQVGYGTNSVIPFPSPTDFAAHLFPVYIWETDTNAWRGKIPALFAPIEYTNGVYQNKERIMIDNKIFMSFRLGVAAAPSWGNYFISLDQSDWA